LEALLRRQGEGNDFEEYEETYSDNEDVSFFQTKPAHLRWKQPLYPF
jgi:hypothetical protein